MAFRSDPAMCKGHEDIRGSTEAGGLASLVLTMQPRIILTRKWF